MKFSPLGSESAFVTLFTVAITASAMAQTSWPFPAPRSTLLGIGSFKTGQSLPLRIKPDARQHLEKTPQTIEGFVAVAGIMALEPRSSYIMVERLHAGDKESPSQKQTAFYWAPTTIGLTAPMWSPNGQTIAFREGFRAPLRGDASNVALWNLKSSRFQRIGAKSKIQPVFWPYFQWSPGSRYLSYLRGGSAAGDFDQWSSPYELFVYDTHGNKERRVEVSTDLFWSWTHTGTILTSIASANPRDNALMANARMPIYEINLGTLQKKMLIQQGAFPMASPDNQWVAFFDWSGPLFRTHEVPTVSKLQLHLWNRATRKAYPVHAWQMTYRPRLQWSSDSKSLYLISEAPDSGIYKLDVSRDLLNARQAVTNWHKVATLPTSGERVLYDFKGTSTDGKTIYIESKGIGEQEPRLLRCDYTLFALNSTTNAIFPVITDSNLGEVEHWEWRGQSGMTAPQQQANKLEKSLPTWANSP